MVLMRIKIAGFDRFWDTFTTRGKAKRSEFGSQGARVFRNADADDEMVILFDWNRKDFERFLADPEVPQIMQQAGLQGRPEPIFCEPAGELPA
jgi:hypothetical protein